MTRISRNPRAARNTRADSGHEPPGDRIRIVAAACFAIPATGVGSHIAFGVFFKPLLADFGWPRANLAGAHSLAFVLSGFIGIFMGRLNDRVGPRAVMTVTALFFGLGLFLMSTVTSLWQIYLFYGIVVGIGLSPVDVIALSTTARWFVRRRSMMSGIVKVGTGTGQLIVPFAASLLILSYGSYGLRSPCHFCHEHARGGRTGSQRRRACIARGESGLIWKG